jgi:hypothetical protein
MNRLIRAVLIHVALFSPERLVRFGSVSDRFAENRERLVVATGANLQGVLAVTNEQGDYRFPLLPGPYCGVPAADFRAWWMRSRPRWI